MIPDFMSKQLCCALSLCFSALHSPNTGLTRTHTSILCKSHSFFSTITTVLTKLKEMCRLRRAGFIRRVSYLPISSFLCLVGKDYSGREMQRWSSLPGRPRNSPHFNLPPHLQMTVAWRLCLHYSA